MLAAVHSSVVHGGHTVDLSRSKVACSQTERDQNNRGGGMAAKQDRCNMRGLPIGWNRGGAPALEW